MSEVNFKAAGYVKSARMGKDGERLVTFEFAASEALNVARLELMSRNQMDYQPVLLLVSVEPMNLKRSDNK